MMIDLSRKICFQLLMIIFQPGNVQRHNDQKISRERMVREQLVRRGISDENVLAAMRSVPRHLFVEEALSAKAYEDYPLPIGFGQTISQPFVVARMSQLLEASPGMRILEIGTGSGYQAAVLDAMGLDVHTVERLRDIYFRTSNLFMRMRLLNIRMKLDDGTLGWPDAGPFDRIIVTAGGPEIPEPLIMQLADPGILVIPVGETRSSQRLVQVRKVDGRTFMDTKDSVSFVDLVGKHGWL